MPDLDISYAKLRLQNRHKVIPMRHKPSIYTSTVIYSLLHQFWLVLSILRFILKLYIIPISSRF